MFSKFKIIGILATFSLMGCQQNTPVQKAANSSIVNLQPTTENKTSKSRLVITRSVKEALPKNKDKNAIMGKICPVAAIYGKLKIRGEGLIIETGGDIDYQPIFSEDSASWNEATRTLTYLGKEYKEGDEIRVGGGILSNETEFRKLPNVSIPNSPNTTLFSVCP